MYWLKIIFLIVAGLVALVYTIYHFGVAITWFRIGRTSKRAREEGEEWVTLTHQAYESGMKGDYQKSIELARKAIELNPRASEAWRLIGNAYEFLGDEAQESSSYDQAREYHKKATDAWNKAKEISPKIAIPGYHE
jgi:tetratricopeptide (TPR) repeat protein